MSPTRRIIFNIVATYGRSLLALAFGLFSSRWVLMSLGQCDYGLYGVVGGVTAFIAFFNGLLGAAVSRFYAVAVGQSESELNKGQGLDECRRWFNIAITIHTVLPFVLMAIGYPLGEWAVRNYLTIPSDRVPACVWVLRFACVTCFVSMVNGPFSAMYYAKQCIAELTIYGVAQTIINFLFLYFMITHPGDWLVRYAFAMCLIAIIPQILICVRALQVFPECKINLRYLWSWARFKVLGTFAFWQLLGGVAWLARNQGIMILINKVFGPCVNASFSIANTVSGQTKALTSALQTAFQPAIIACYGRGDVSGMQKMAFQACKFGVLLTIIFVMPISLELREVLFLWLRNPPEFAYGLCLCVMLILIIDECSFGHMIAVAAKGKIALYQAVLSLFIFCSLPVAWFLVFIGFSVYSVGGALVITMLCCSLGRVVFAKYLVGMSIRYWIKKIVLPITVATAISAFFAYCIRFKVEESFVRVLLSTAIFEFLFGVSAWKILLDNDEKAFVLKRVLQVKERILRR